MKNIMYYPRIVIPSEWMKKTLLYSDTISSIYPKDFNDLNGHEEEIAHRDMEILHAEGIYVYTDPEQIDFLVHEKVLNELKRLIHDDNLSSLRNSFNTRACFKTRFRPTISIKSSSKPNKRS
ncbi:hypothetical protein, partial [Saccharibacillus qingshengii]|uniref:hypothetical protein n=1 Tax=Saccharibacillus qingshengii TaxID=1763540 RepID=UPI001552C126